MKLEQKKVLITGATGGIGMAVAQALASKGCQLLLTGRDHSKLDKLATSLSGSGHSTLVTDLNESEGLKLLHAAAEAFEIDIMINSMGINQLSLLSESSENDIENIMTTNLTTPILVCKTMLPLLIEKSDTAIVNIGSISGFISMNPQPQAFYNASKAAVHHLTKSLAAEWAKRGVRVNAVAPTYIETPLTAFGIKENPAMYKMWLDMTPMGCVGQPDEIASVVHFLSSDASSLMTGAIVVADAGYLCW